MTYQFLLIILLCLMAGTSSALTEDRDLPVHIEANKATMDETTGISLYEGQVVITQGTLKITADMVEVKTVNSEVTKIVASTEKPGRLSHYEEMPDDREGLITADAKTITYEFALEKVKLEGSAKLTQVKDIYRGELLTYDARKGFVTLNSSGKPGDRVSITFTPKQKSSDE